MNSSGQSTFTLPCNRLIAARCARAKLPSRARLRTPRASSSVPRSCASSTPRCKSVLSWRKAALPSTPMLLSVIPRPCPGALVATRRLACTLLCEGGRAAGRTKAGLVFLARRSAATLRRKWARRAWRAAVAAVSAGSGGKVLWWRSSSRATAASAAAFWSVGAAHAGRQE